MVRSIAQGQLDTSFLPVDTHSLSRCYRELIDSLYVLCVLRILTKSQSCRPALAIVPGRAGKARDEVSSPTYFRLRFVLVSAFLKPTFRGKQKEIAEAAVRGCDVLVVAPTGMGKVR